MDKDIIQRIERLITDAGINRNILAIRAGIQSSNLTRMMNGQQAITDRTITRIANALNANAEWIKKGVGDMYIETAGTTIQQTAVGHHNTQNIGQPHRDQAHDDMMAEIVWLRERLAAEQDNLRREQEQTRRLTEIIASSISTNKNS